MNQTEKTSNTFKKAAQKRRWLRVFIVFMGILLALITAIIGLRENINLYCEPSDIKKDLNKINTCKRLGGLVLQHSFKHKQTPGSVEFVLFDAEHQVTVFYTGVLPDLFKEKQGIVANGEFLNKNEFNANQVLAKHDENYTPRPDPTPSAAPSSTRGNDKTLSVTPK